MTGVLDGIRVLDFSRLLPGPYCTWLLADQGAEVIRVEHPRELEKQARVFGWDRLDDEGRRMVRARDMLARGKKSVLLDIGDAAAQSALARLAGTVDVVVEDYRPGVLDGLGLGYATLAEANPALVYASLTLCGQTGAYRSKPGHDPIALALSGVLSRTGGNREAPDFPGIAAADIATGSHAAFAILAALFKARSTGHGRQVDVAMTDCSMMLIANLLSRHENPADIPPRGYRRADMGLWKCADGKWLCTTDMEPRYWQRFCEVVGHPEYVPLQHDAHRLGEIRQTLEAVFASESRAAWIEKLGLAGTQFAPVYEVGEALADPNHAARGLVVEVAMPDGSTRKQLGSPVRFADQPQRGVAVPPGADNDHILSELGLSAEEISNLTPMSGLDETGSGQARPHANP